jgi:hypothetical protein
MAFNPVVRTSNRLWSEECARADAIDSLEAPEPGVQALVERQPYDRAYEFSNGRKFRDKRNPYE